MKSRYNVFFIPKMLKGEANPAKKLRRWQKNRLSAFKRGGPGKTNDCRQKRKKIKCMIKNGNKNCECKKTLNDDGRRKKNITEPH